SVGSVQFNQFPFETQTFLPDLFHEVFADGRKQIEALFPMADFDLTVIPKGTFITNATFTILPTSASSFSGPPVGFAMYGIADTDRIVEAADFDATMTFVGILSVPQGGG